MNNYLKPNFKPTHPANYLFLILLFIGSFLLTTTVQAFEDDTTWTDGQFFYVGGAGSVPNNAGPTVSAACANAGIPLSPYFPSHWKCKSGNTYYQVYNSACGSGNSSLEGNLSGCGQSPGPECPASGVSSRLGTVVNGTYVDGVFVLNPPSDGVIEIGGTLVDDNQCKHAIATGENVTNPSKTYVRSDGSIVVYRDVISTGEAATDQEYLDAPLVSYTDEQSFINENDGVTDNTQDTKVVSIDDPVISTDPDGTNVTTDKTTTVETRDDGVKITKESETFFISESGGIIKNEVVTKTTYDHPDGTQTVTTETVKQYTQTPITNYTINNVNGRTTVTAGEGSGATTTTTTTDTYDAQGNKTGSSETSSSTGEGEAAEEAGKDECDESGENCEDEFTETESGSFDLTAAATELQQAKDAYADYIETLKEQITNEFGFNFTGGGSIQSHEVSFKGQSGDIGLTRWVPYFDSFSLGALVMFIAAMVSLYILLGGRRD